MDHVPASVEERRALLIAPSDDFVRTLPRGKIPDRKDFYAMDEATRLRTWQRVVDESARLGDELAELQVTGRLADRLEPW